MSDAHYWKHGIYRGSPNVTHNATTVILDGFTRALTFEDAAYGAFGDQPNSAPAAPVAQSLPAAPVTQSLPAASTPRPGVTSRAVTTVMSTVLIFVLVAVIS